MHEKQFLKDVAAQNYTKYNVNVSDWWNHTPPHNISGRMYLVTQKLRGDNKLKRIATAIYGNMFRQKSQLDAKIRAHLPVYVESPVADDDGGGMDFCQ